MGHWLTPWIFSVLAIVELVTDQLPSTPSRKVPQQFGARLVTGALCGAAIGASAGADDRRPGCRRDRRGDRYARRLRGAQAAGRRDRRPRPADRAGRGCDRDRRRAADRELGVVSRKFDAIIVGAGQAGPSLAGRLTAAGMNVAVIERKLFGGTCVNTGCIPTKTLVASAYAAHLARRGGDFGVIARRPGRRRHEEGQGAQGRGVGRVAPRPRRLARRHGALHRVPRPCPLRGTAHDRDQRRGDRGRENLPQSRRPRQRARYPGHRRGQLSHQHVDPRARHACRGIW